MGFFFFFLKRENARTFKSCTTRKGKNNVTDRKAEDLLVKGDTKFGTKIQHI